MLKPFRVCIASPADRWLAGLFLLVGAHMAVIGSSFSSSPASPRPARVGHARHSDAGAGGDGGHRHRAGIAARMPPLRMLAVVFAPI
jgi:hypothetical protein